MNAYQPDRVFPPGETLLELLEDRWVSRADLAGRTRLSRETIDEIIAGQAGMTADIGFELERVFAIRASFWRDLERN